MAEYQIVQLKPAVLQLPVHLEGEQTVVYNNNPEEAGQALANSQVTALTAYFTANELIEDAQQVKYEEFPKRFVWNRTHREWTVRHLQHRIPQQIGRLITIHPNQGEKFYLRLLLKHKAGATSYQSLQSVDGVEHPTFKAACIAMNLLQDDQQWHECLEEAAQIASPSQVRQLFCNILLQCEPSDPRGLFDIFQDAMSEDFLHRRSQSVIHSEDEIRNLVYNDVLCCLDESFQEQNKTNTDFSLPEPNYQLMVQNILEESEMDPNAGAFWDHHLPLLNEEQRGIYDLLVDCIVNETGGLFRIDAPGGT